MIAVCQINSQFGICRNLAKKVNENVRWTPNDTKTLLYCRLIDWCVMPTLAVFQLYICVLYLRNNS
jgi:hypothetical protein